MEGLAQKVFSPLTQIWNIRLIQINEQVKQHQEGRQLSWWEYEEKEDRLQDKAKYYRNWFARCKHSQVPYHMRSIPLSHGIVCSCCCLVWANAIYHLSVSLCICMVCIVSAGTAMYCPLHPGVHCNAVGAVCVVPFLWIAADIRQGYGAAYFADHAWWERPSPSLATDSHFV